MDDPSCAPRTCLICSTPNDAVRYGIDACRACAMFYKRAQRSGQRIECKNGKRKCEIKREDVSKCRGCRYDKCAALGMSYEVPIMLPNPDSQSGDNSVSPSEHVSEPDESGSSSKSASPLTRVQNPKNEPDDEPISISPTVRSSDSLLDRIAREHATWFEHMRELEMSVVRQHNLKRLSHPSEEIYLIPFDLAIATLNANLINSWKFFQSVFPSLKDYSSADQCELFKMCMPAFTLANTYFRTKVIWGCFTKYTMFSAITCTDKQNPDGWLGLNKEGPMQRELLESMGAYSRNQMTLVVPSYEKADICEREHYALLALILCESDISSDLAERYLTFIEGTRKEILEDLHRFYTEDMRLSEYSTRLGNLMSLCHIFQESSAIFQEFFRMQVTVFDLYTTEKLLQDLVL